MVAFWLPLAQYEALGWCDAPPWFRRLHPTDFMLHTDASGPRDFRALRKGKTLALAKVLQTCIKESGVPTGILCGLAKVLQKYMAPLITISGVDTIEASLSKHTEEEHGIFPTLEEEAILLGEKSKATSLLEHWQISEPPDPQSKLMLSPSDPLSKLMLLVSLLFPPLCHNLAATLPRS